MENPLWWEDVDAMAEDIADVVLDRIMQQAKRRIQNLERSEGAAVAAKRIIPAAYRLLPESGE